MVINFASENDNVESIVVKLNYVRWTNDETESRGLAERDQEEEKENEQHKGYILCLGYLATID